MTAIRQTTTNEMMGLAIAGAIMTLEKMHSPAAARAALQAIAGEYQSDETADHAVRLLGYTVPRVELKAKDNSVLIESLQEQLRVRSETAEQWRLTAADRLAEVDRLSQKVIALQFELGRAEGALKRVNEALDTARADVADGDAALDQARSHA